MQYEVKGSTDGSNWGAGWMNGNGWTVRIDGHHQYGLITGEDITTVDAASKQRAWKMRAGGADPFSVRCSAWDQPLFI
eukprot:gene58132-biopygen94108